MKAAAALEPDLVSRAGLEREIGRRYGSVFPEMRATTLDVAFARAAGAVGASTLAELLGRVLRGEPDVLGAIVRETMVGETYFFREMEGISRLEVQGKRAVAQGRPLIVWSAGCASGEETYSLAIFALETLGAAAAVQILGSDVNPGAIERAEKALYGPWSFRNVAPERQARWFERVGELLRPIAEVRARVQFRAINLAADDALDNRWPTQCDLILCRNVLLYFAPAAGMLVARRFASSLASRGELVLASTDPALESTALRHTHPVPPVYVRAENDARDERVVFSPRSRSRLTPTPRAPTPPPRVQGRGAALTPGRATLSPFVAAPLARFVAAAAAPARASAAALAPGAVLPTGELEAPLALARTLADGARYEEAKQLLDTLVAAHPLAAPPRVLRAFVLLSLRDASAALRDADAALLLDAAAPVAHVVSAMAAAELGDGVRARRSARNALAALGPLDSNDPADERSELARTCRALLVRRGGSPPQPALAMKRAKAKVTRD